MKMLPKKIQRGYIMVEIMLGTIVMGMILAVALEMATSGDDQSTGRIKAENISSFSQLTSQYLLSNKEAIDIAMTNFQDQSDIDASDEAAKTHCKINVAADGTGGTIARNTSKHTCAFDATLLKSRGAWPNGVATDVAGGRYVAIIRKIYGPGENPGDPEVATGGLELLVALSPIGPLSGVGEDGRKTTELISTMTALGGSGGIIPAKSPMAGCNTLEACGNGWKLNLSDFIDSAEMATFSQSIQ